ncbi:AMP-binding protein [Xanthobacter dioxanivorans]|uniref:AMP-binding protein n=1 Tax=Xanthobacter dioxanivorans TaxID=2528964 RepID=A0A974PPF4_9HYPH|nr:AMP-binding protein [Xanthobacter dioxanivorans]QRG07348.1 AMP-binding protein [Xanthobacter dioxanivorans]
MIEVSDTSTIGAAFEAAARTFAERPFLAVPRGAHRPYHRDGYEISYADAARAVGALREAYGRAGFGHGHRVAMLLDNRPEHLLHKLALAGLGICCVPVNPDYRPNELAYLIDHAEVDLAIVAPERREQLDAGLAVATAKPPVVPFDALELLPAPARPRRADPVTGASAASILYTSGTTGRPKGCILSHGYELEAGAWYATRGQLARVSPDGERIYNPLPLYHVNSSVLSFFCAMLTGGCQIQSDRFHPDRWWTEVRETRATIVHYLGVVVPMLLARPESPQDRSHSVRFGLGAGVEPPLHAAFEARFGFPLVEVWGMTEMVRVLLDNEEGRPAGTRCFGHPVPGIDVRVVDDRDEEVPTGVPGELVVRHSAQTPRRGFFSGYLKSDEATAEAWRNGWFHTGDVVRQDAAGGLYFVDRKKNIIRRSGENIAAAEIEAVLLAHPGVAQVAVLAAPDPIREEEVFACIVLKNETDRPAMAEELFAYCCGELAYYKAPGWIYFLDRLPTTGTQKIQKHQIFPDGVPPFDSPDVFDMRGRKKRTPLHAAR